eukprot:SAG22_NODE_1393_length_4514_cov_2.889468_5_plen_180_part_00
MDQATSAAAGSIMPHGPVGGGGRVEERERHPALDHDREEVLQDLGLRLEAGLVQLCVGRQAGRKSRAAQRGTGTPSEQDEQDGGSGVLLASSSDGIGDTQVPASSSRRRRRRRRTKPGARPGSQAQAGSKRTVSVSTAKTSCSLWQWNRTERHYLRQKDSGSTTERQRLTTHSCRKYAE